MNKIVIIGNGFDIAHELPTKYEQFMNYILDSIVQKVSLSSSSYRYETIGQKCRRDSNYIHKLTSEQKEDPWIGAKLKRTAGKYQFETNPHSKSKSIYFNSLFKKNSRSGYWSDLEFHYFEILKNHRNNLNDVITINEEFEHLKKLLNHYLKTEIEDNFGSTGKYKVDKSNPIYQMLISGHNDYDFQKHYFITFNYTTKILHQYVEWLRKLKKVENVPINPIFIHGDVINPQNPIIFGYGDDNSEEYKELQNTKQKELLKNFKTFQYLRSNRYRQVLGLLEENDEIYVQIIGHSCDICDKALLRTIFEHQNVKHIEATYYENENRYFENLFNISRIFNDNTLMREKLIPLEETFKII